MGDGLQTRQPNGPPDDLGGTEAAFYFVEDGALTMCEENGKPCQAVSTDTVHASTLARCMLSAYQVQ